MSSVPAASEAWGHTRPGGSCLLPLPPADPTRALGPGAEALKGGWKLLAVSARGVTATMLDDRRDTISVPRRRVVPEPALHRTPAAPHQP